MTNYKMNFVKSSIYQQEITCSGIKEKEIETIDPEEKKLYERLRKLPEFTTDPNYKSLAEQLQENEQMQYPEASDDPYPYAPCRVTVEDAEFFEQLERDQLRRKKFRHLREELELEGFRAEAKNLCTSVSKTEGEDEEEIEEGERKKTSSSGSTVTDTQPVLSVVSSHQCQGRPFVQLVPKRSLIKKDEEIKQKGTNKQYSTDINQSESLKLLQNYDEL